MESTFINNEHHGETNRTVASCRIITIYALAYKCIASQTTSMKSRKKQTSSRFLHETMKPSPPLDVKGLHVLHPQPSDFPIALTYPSAQSQIRCANCSPHVRRSGQYCIQLKPTSGCNDTVRWVVFWKLERLRLRQWTFLTSKRWTRPSETLINLNHSA